jgi:hypothetical protein
MTKATTMTRQEITSDPNKNGELAPWLIAPRSYLDLRASVRNALGFPLEFRPLLIGIDGLDGAGKTSLAAWLSW